MSDEPAPADPVITQRGLSDRSRQLLAGTRRTDDSVASDERPHRVIRSLWWPLVYVVLALSAVDFAVVPLIWAARGGYGTGSLVVALGGLTTVQVFLIAVGLIFGRQSLTNRLIVSWALLFIVFVCWAAGYFSSVFTAAEEIDLGGLRWFAYAGMAWCVLVSVLLGAVLPLLFVRGVLGWRLTNPDEVRERERLGPEPPSRYTLRDLLVLMTMIGATLGVPRFTYDPRAGRYDNEFFWAGLAICTVSTCLACLLIVRMSGPLLRPHAPVDWVWSVITWLAWSALLSIGLGLGANLGSYLWLGIAWLIWLQVFTGGALAGILVLHAHGWRWETARQPLRLS